MHCNTLIVRLFIQYQDLARSLQFSWDGNRPIQIEKGNHTMKLELFFMRALFVIATTASVSAMGGLLRSDLAPTQKTAQAQPVPAPVHAG